MQNFLLKPYTEIVLAGIKLKTLPTHQLSKLFNYLLLKITRLEN